MLARGEKKGLKKTREIQEQQIFPLAEGDYYLYVGIDQHFINVQIKNIVLRNVLILTLILFATLLVEIYLVRCFLIRPLKNVFDKINDISVKLGLGYEDTQTDLDLQNLIEAIEDMDQLIQSKTVNIHQLEMERRRFVDVAENSGDWIWECDARGRIGFSSHMQSQVLSLSSENILGQVFTHSSTPGDEKEQQEKFVKFLLEKLRFTIGAHRISMGWAKWFIWKPMHLP